MPTCVGVHPHIGQISQYLLITLHRYIIKIEMFPMNFVFINIADFIYMHTCISHKPVSIQISNMCTFTLTRTLQNWKYALLCTQIDTYQSDMPYRLLDSPIVDEMDRRHRGQLVKLFTHSWQKEKCMHGFSTQSIRLVKQTIQLSSASKSLIFALASSSTTRSL